MALQLKKRDNIFDAFFGGIGDALFGAPKQQAPPPAPVMTTGQGALSPAVLRARQQVAAPPPVQRPNVGAAIGSAVNGVGNWVNNEVVKPAVSSFNTTRDVVQTATGQNEVPRKAFTGLAQFAKDDLNSGMSQNSQSLGQNNLATKDRAQIAGDVAGTFLNVAGGGVGGSAARLGAEQGAKQVFTRALREGGQNAAFGGAYGANSAVQDKGMATRPLDIAGGAVTGAALGGAIGAALPLAGAGARAAYKAATPYVRESVAAAQAAPEARRQEGWPRHRRRPGHQCQRQLQGRCGPSGTQGQA